jgi:hypothetical protein
MFQRSRAAARAVLCSLLCFTPVRAVTAQEPAAPEWQFMQDGVIVAEFNRQGGPRGGSEFVVPNWWMGMAARSVAGGPLTLTAMLSLDAATEGRSGYREIFQVGETLDGVPLVDRQHPHDFFMQLAGSWRMPIGAGTGVTIAGGPVGEPALGPVAFMHRPSAADIPFAPLSHHTFDSTHIAFGVVTAALDHGPWLVEGSAFNGREPDDNRWNFDFGPLDSVSGRVWFRPSSRWEFQVSSAHLKDPERLEPGDVQRTTTSGSWFERNGDDYVAVTAGYGVNATDHGRRHALFGEMTRRAGSNAWFTRVELVQVETALLTGTPIDAAARDTVGAVTVGGVRDILRGRGFEGGIGGAATFYAVPEALKATHGDRPVSFEIFFRLRLPATGGMGRMWNMRMSQPMGGHVGS